MKFSKSHHICCVPIELQDKCITGHLVWQTAASLRGRGELRTEPQRNATAEIHFQLRRRGTKQPSSPLFCSFNLFSVWMFDLVSPLVTEADNRLRKISLSTFSIQEDSGVSWTQINKILHYTILSAVCVCVCVYVSASWEDRDSKLVCIALQ